MLPTPATEYLMVSAAPEMLAARIVVAIPAADVSPAIPYVVASSPFVTVNVLPSPPPALLIAVTPSYKAAWIVAADNIVPLNTVLLISAATLPLPVNVIFTALAEDTVSPELKV